MLRKSTWIAAQKIIGDKVIGEAVEIQKGEDVISALSGYSYAIIKHSKAEAEETVKFWNEMFYSSGVLVPGVWAPVYDGFIRSEV